MATKTKTTNKTPAKAVAKKTTVKSPAKTTKTSAKKTVTKSTVKNATAKTSSSKKAVIKKAAPKPTIKYTNSKSKAKKPSKIALVIFFIVFFTIIVIAFLAMQREKYEIGGRTYTKIADYLYEVTYEDYQQTEATEYMQANYPYAGAAACSSVRNGDFYGRNYDWYYDESADFVLHMTATEDRHASIGIAGSLPTLTDEFVTSGEDNFAYEILPLITVDGINDAGVGINVNVVPVGDAGRTTGTNPGKENLLINTVARFILDNADSVDDAIELLNSRNIYVATGTSLDMEFHFMISDPTTTKVVEFVDNKMVVLDDENIMTNYYLSIPETEYSMGTQRYKILSDNYELGKTKAGMLELMQKVNYTKSYDLTLDDFWYSEYYDPATGVGKNSDEKVIQAYIDYYQDAYINRERDGKTWQTVHTSVYDLKNKTLSLIVQENGKVFDFNL